MPESAPLGVRLMPADHGHFPAGTRKAVVMRRPPHDYDGLSRLLSLGEFCAIHLMCWSNALWPQNLPTYSELFWEGPLESAPVERDEVMAGIALPPAIWQLHTGLYPESTHGFKERCEESKKLASFDTRSSGKLLNCIADTRSSRKLTKRKERWGEKYHSVLPRRPAQGAPRARERCYIHDLRRPRGHGRLEPVATLVRQGFRISPGPDCAPQWAARLSAVPGMGQRPKGVRRSVVQPNGTITPGPRQELLAAVTRLFPPGDAEPPNKAAADEIDRLLGLDGSDPPVRWHYAVDGPRHRLALDTRTRRAFATHIAPPSNLSAAALREQIPEAPLPAGIEVLVLISPLPLFGLPLFDELAGPLAYKGYDAFKFRTIAGMPGTNPDAAEGWANVPEVLEETLQRLAPYRRIVVLSGDVHYAHSAEVSYWVAGDERPSRFAQFTSSGFKNKWPDAMLVLNRGFAFAQDMLQVYSPLTRLGWKKNEPAPLNFPSGSTVVGGARALLMKSPVLLPTHGWPRGTAVARQPDWAWRLTVCRDPRTELPVPRSPRCSIRSTLPRMLRFRSKVTGAPPGRRRAASRKGNPYACSAVCKQRRLHHLRARHRRVDRAA